MADSAEMVLGDKKKANSRMPYSADLLEDGLPKLMIDDENWRAGCLRVWASALIGRTFLLRGSGHADVEL